MDYISIISYPLNDMKLSKNEILYNGIISVLNNKKPVAYLSFYDNNDFERNLVNVLLEHDIKTIQIMPNLWITFKNEEYLNNALYILSLFCDNEINQLVDNCIEHIIKFSEMCINPYDCIFELIMGNSKMEIKQKMLENYILLHAKIDDSDSIFFENKKLNSLIKNGINTANDSSEIILFDDTFNFVINECEKVINYIFNESCTFHKFVLNNKNKIENIKQLRIKVNVPKITAPTITNLLEPEPVKYPYNYNYNYSRKKRRNKKFNWIENFCNF